MSGVYDTDILVWSEDQAALLRRLAAGERVNDQVDWTNVIEEIESVGSEQLHAVEFSAHPGDRFTASRRWPGRTHAMRTTGALTPSGSPAMQPTGSHHPCCSVWMLRISTGAPCARCPRRCTA